MRSNETDRGVEKRRPTILRTRIQLRDERRSARICCRANAKLPTASKLWRRLTTVAYRTGDQSRMNIECIPKGRHRIIRPRHDHGTILIRLVSSRSQCATRRRLGRRTVTTVINVREDPGILGQTQRRCRYPDYQQCACRNNSQSSHVAEKYRFGCIIPAKSFRSKSLSIHFQSGRNQRGWNQRRFSFGLIPNSRRRQIT